MDQGGGDNKWSGAGPILDIELRGRADGLCGG